MCKVYTGYCGTSEIEHGLCACTVDNPRAKARGLSLRTGAQTMLYLSLISPRHMLWTLIMRIYSMLSFVENCENIKVLHQSGIVKNKK